MEKVITNTNYQEILAGPGLLVIDFWATWCGPCRILAPTVDELANEYAGRATVAKCNVDDCEEIAAQFGIRNIPTLVFVKNGAIVDRTVGVLPKQDIAAKIEQYL
ncbi:MAG: thioredoxin [Bacteroidales bacterium]|nr:thioredoxin [Bacteroidales bacterium]